MNIIISLILQMEKLRTQEINLLTSSQLINMLPNKMHLSIEAYSKKLFLERL